MDFSDIKVLEAKGKHSATMIFIHGLGETADEWIDKFKDILPAHVKLVCPQARKIKFTADNIETTGWYDVSAIAAEGIDNHNVDAAYDSFKELLDNEISNEIPSDRIILGGFSQGGCVALYTAFKYGEKLAALFVLSSCLSAREKVLQFAEENVHIRTTPFLMYHGTVDQRMEYVWGQWSFNVIKQYLKTAFFRTLQRVGHYTTEQELKGVCGFLNKYVPPK